MDDDYYDILGIQKNANLNDIRLAYYKIIKLLHPDNNNNTNTTKYDKVLLAYQTLSDPIKKKNYDHLLNGLNNIGPIHDQIDLDDMFYRNNTYTYHCRCGGTFIVTELQLSNSINVVECDQCSLCISLLYQLNE
ncbi:DnaJ domain-containing protein [Globomyces pollinis-pini]|nr:DnaJ domain-containing protein [Globomyces pollinis-pini]